jgi:hypothetical protein
VRDGRAGREPGPAPAAVALVGRAGVVKPYYEDESVTLYHGDCREVLPSLTESVDVILTDPPYGAGVAAWDATWPPWIEEVAVAPTVALLPGVMNLGKLGQTFGGLPYRWTLAGLLPTPARSPFGLCHWNPCVVYADPAVSLMKKSADARRIPVFKNQPSWHPSPKSLSLMRWLVGVLPSGVVCDPFAGSGTTLLAARDSGVPAIGIEMDERYCELIAGRLAQGDLFGGVA